MESKRKSVKAARPSAKSISKQKNKEIEQTPIECEERAVSKPKKIQTAEGWKRSVMKQLKSPKK